MKYILIIWAMLAAGGIALAQSNAVSTTGEIRGKVIDSKTKKPLDYASIILMSTNGKVVATELSDDDGSYIFKKLEPGDYTLKFVYVGYNNSIVNNITVRADIIEFINVAMNALFLEKTICMFSCCCGGTRVITTRIEQPKSLLVAVQQAQAMPETEAADFTCIIKHRSRAIEQKEAGTAKLLNQVTLFPNPANEALHVESMFDGNKQLYIYNMGGVLVYSGSIVNHASIATSQLPNGVYFATVIDAENDDKATGKFVVVH